MKPIVSALVFTCLSLGLVFGQSKDERKWQYLGRLSENPFAGDSTSNVFGTYGSPFSSKSINNPFSRAGRAASDPYASGRDSAIIVGQDGKYLGRLNSNPYDPDSVANPFGRYGSQFSPDSINNPLGRYGNPYSPYSARNPYATQAPRLFLPDSGSGSVRSTKKPEKR